MMAPEPNRRLPGKDDIYCFEVRGWDQFFPGAENSLPALLV